MTRAVLLVGALAFAAVVLWLLTQEEPPALDATVPTEDGASADTPTLRGAIAGAGEATLDPWDPRAFVLAVVREESGLSRRVAALTLADPAAARRLAEHLVDSLRQRYDEERPRAGSLRANLWLPSIVEALRLLGPLGAESLAAVLADADISLRIRSAWALGLLGDLAVPHVPALAARARDLSDEPTVRAAVVRALGTLGPRASEITPDVIRWSRDETTHEDLAEAVAGALLRVAGTTSEAIEAARAILVRQAFAPSIALLGAIRERAGEAASLAPDILELLATVQQDGPVEREALGVLGAIATGDPEAQRFLLETFEDEDRRDSVRGQAAAILSRSGASGRKSLLDAASRREDEDRLLAFDAVVDPVPRVGPWHEDEGPPPPPPLPADLLALLLPLLDSRDEDVQRGAVNRLAARVVGEDIGRLLPSLLASTRSPDRWTRYAALGGLTSLREPRKEALDEALRALRDPDASVRFEAVQTLRRHAPVDEKATLQALESLLRDRETGMRLVALDVLPDFAKGHREAVLAALDRAAADPEPMVARQAEHWRTKIRRGK